MALPFTRNQSTTARLDRESFSVAYREAYPALVLVARAQGAKDDSEDVAQRAAIVALERLDQFEAGTNFRAWMSAIVRGVARNHRRSRTRMDARHMKLAAAETLDHNPYESHDEESPRVHISGGSIRVDVPERFHSDLRNAIDRLGPIQGACLVLKVVQGHSYDEISAMLDIPVATARSHVFRARGVLAAMLKSGRGDDA